MKTLEFSSQTFQPTLASEDKKIYWISALIGVMRHAQIKNWLEPEGKFLYRKVQFFFLTAS